MPKSKAPPKPSTAPSATKPAVPPPVAPCEEEKKKKVVTINAKVPGTNGVRKASDTRPDDNLSSSSSTSESLASNAPVVLVRGCHDVQLSADTSPANEPVQWEVKPNENSEAAPTITPTDGGKKATLKTDKAGSFSVIAKLDGTQVVWNVVFAWVKVDPATSVITSRDDKFADNGSNASRCRFKSGEFSAGNYAWEGSVKLKVLGGGSDQKMGIDKVKVQVLQNGITDTLTGNYDGGGTALEVPKGGLPVLDATGSGSPFIVHPDAGKITPSNSGTDREWWSGDSPAGGFPKSHKNTGKPLKSISGVNGFVIAVASVSDDAQNSIVVHAKTAWSADFSGTLDAAGVYTPNGKVTKEAAFSLISEGTGGQDAKDANFETFEPRFNGGTDTTWNP